MLDSGNIWRCCLSEEYANQIGITDKELRPLTQTVVQTAKDGAALTVLGETKQPLKLQFGDLPVRFSFRPVVLRDLTMPCNISGPFLRRHNIDQLHSKNAIRVQSQLIPLCKDLESPSLSSIEAPFVNAYAAATVQVPPFSHAVLSLQLPQIAAGHMPPGDGLLEGEAAFGTVTGCVPTLAALVSADKAGRTETLVVNPFSEPAVIKEGVKFGTFRKACHQGEDTERPWRIAVVGAGKLDGRSPSSPKKGLVLRQKLAEAIEKAKVELDTTKKVTNDNPSKWTKEKKRNWIRDAFKLNQAPMLKNEEDREQAVTLLLHYFDCISINGEFGETNLMEHEIHTGDHPPIKLRHRPINPALENDLKAQLAKWQEQDVIEQSKSPWSFPLVAAPKKGGKIRWCVDYRKLNDITTKDTHPLPSIEDNLVRLADSTVFSTLDGAGAFHVLPIKKEDRNKTSFSTPWGTWRFRRMPFGLCNGPASYSRLVQLVLHGIPGEVALPYLDDTIVHAPDVPTHMRHLARVLLAHRKAGLKLQPAKCHLFQDQVEYLGHLVGASGVGPVPSYVQAVQDWPLPKTKSEARTFLGKCGYYRRFIRNYSAIAGPWTDVTGKGTAEEEKTALEITPQMKESFLTLKKALLTAPVLAYPQFHNPNPFILDTDWSRDCNAIGAVLSQVQDGQERVIMYGAKKLATSQKSYGSTKGEVCAVFHFFKAWSYYLRHRPFILRTDHQPLKYLKTMAPLDGHVERWLTAMGDYDFEVVHRSGKAHANADSLSRAVHIAKSPPASSPLGTDEERIAAVVVTDVRGDAVLFSAAQMKEAQENDTTLSQVLQWKRTQPPDSLAQKALSPEAAFYLQLLPQLCINKEGVLQYLKPQASSVAASPLITCLPKDLWDQVIRVAHETGGHMGITATLNRVRQHFFFPAMKREVAAVLQGCHQCQQKRGPAPDQRGLLLTQVNGWPFQRLSLDFVGPLTRSKKGHCYILTVRDTFSGWLEAFPLRRATAEAAAALLESQIFFRYGIPESIHTDQGTQFTSAQFRHLTNLLQIQATTTPSYNPKSNPVERAHRDLGAMLRALQNSYDGQPHTWDQLLPQAVFAMNTAVSASTGLSPYQIIFNRLPSTPLSTIFGAPPQEPLPPSATVSEAQRHLQRRAEIAHQYVRHNLQSAVVRRRRQYNQSCKEFQPGAQVWLFSPVNKLHISRKLNLHWTGPWTILRRVNPVLYEVKPHPSWHFPRSSLVVSVDRLLLYHPPKQSDGNLLNLPPPMGADLALAGDEWAEHINTDDNYDDDDYLALQNAPPPLLAPSPPSTPPSSDEEADDDDHDVFVDAQAATPPGSPLSTSDRGLDTPRDPAPPVPQPSSAPADGPSSEAGVFSPSPPATARRRLDFGGDTPSPEQGSSTASTTGTRPKRSTAGRPPRRYSPSPTPPPVPPKPRLDLELFPDGKRRVIVKKKVKDKEPAAAAQKGSSATGTSVAEAVKKSTRSRKPPDFFGFPPK